MEIVTNKTLEKLKYDLVRDGLVSYENLEKAQETALAQNVNIGSILIKTGLITEEKLLKFLESKLKIPYVDLKDYTLDKKCLSYINFNDAGKYKIIPLFKIENVLTAAMADPLDLFAIDKIAAKIGCEIEPVICEESLVLKKIDEYYNTEYSAGRINIETSESGFDWQEELNNDVMSEEHIQALIKAVLKQAVLNNIHEVFFEHTIDGLSVNFRQGAEIKPEGSIPSVLTAAFISKLKTLSSLDASVCELPQLGRLVFKVNDMVLSAGISAFPTINGERISLKIYKPPKTLEETGFTKIQADALKSALENAGIILVCGASLSGKTRIIYSLLSEIAAPDKNIMTIEAIAKYSLKNVNQCELNENIGFNIDKAMRFIEFQSPDIIYFESITTKSALDYFSSLVFKNKVLITEFLADNMADLNKKLSYSDFEMFRPLISCIVFIHDEKRFEILNKSEIEKFINID